jgi:hypothetical protein
MATHKSTTKEDVRKSINDERILDSQSFEYLASNINIKRLVIEMIIGGVWGYTLGCVGSNIISALALLAMPAWLSFVSTLFVVVVTLYLAWSTANVVSSTVYEVGAATFVKAKSLFASTKEKVSGFKFATVH